MRVEDLNIKIFADGASKDEILELEKNPLIKGYTCNPTLLRKLQVKSVKDFTKEVLDIIGSKPFSVEVIADDLSEMKRQAEEISSWSKKDSSLYIKIPVTNTKGESTAQIVKELSQAGILVNVTAVFTNYQIYEMVSALQYGAKAILSIFAGRIHDAGVPAQPIVSTAVNLCELMAKNVETLWASPRAVYDICMAEESKCSIITLPTNLISKLNLLGKDLKEFSLETVEMFARDAIAAGFTI